MPVQPLHQADVDRRNWNRFMTRSKTPPSAVSVFSQQELAEKIGVSRMTVHRALSDHPNVSPKTRERIKQLAAAFGYRPNTAARAMRTGRFNAVALVDGVEQIFLPPTLLGSVTRRLARHDMHLSVAEVTDADLAGEEMPKILRELSVDGFLINYVPATQRRTLQMLRSNSVPAIWVNDKQPEDSVYPDDFSAAQTATRELLDLGHKRILYFSMRYPFPGVMHYSVIDRQAGYESAMRAAGLRPDVLTLERGHEQQRGGKDDDRIAVSLEVLSRKPRPTAVVAYETQAAGPMAFAAAKLGLDIPGDLSIVTFHSELVIYFGVRMKIWRLPMQEVGEAAVSMLLRKIDHPNLPIPGEAVAYAESQGDIAPPPR